MCFLLKIVSCLPVYIQCAYAAINTLDLLLQILFLSSHLLCPEKEVLQMKSILPCSLKPWLRTVPWLWPWHIALFVIGLGLGLVVHGLLTSLTVYRYQAAHGLRRSADIGGTALRGTKCRGEMVRIIFEEWVGNVRK